MFCPHCGTTTFDDARFCSTCGRPIVESDPVTIATPEPTVPPPGSSRPASAAPGSPLLDRGHPVADADYAATRAPSHSDHRSSSSSGWLTTSDSISHGRFAPGTILDGRYRIIGLLGKGGMGEVYRADDLRLGQPVALKFLPDAVSADPLRLAQFHNEVRTARQVSHPNICRVYDIGETEGSLYLSMEYVAGEDLATSLRRIGRFPEDKATEIARQLCAGLAAAHDRGVLHRDLKPANVMLDDAGKVRLMDFGLAAVGAVDNVRAGTPAYMAPEQLLGREVTTRSDIYALGLVLYELFTGRRAFTASTLNELIEQHQTGPSTTPSTLVSSLDPAIERAILRCLESDPARRPSTAIAVSAALPGGDPLAAALAAGETPSPEMVAAAGEGAGLSRRIAIPVVAAVLAGLGIAYALALRDNPLERMRPEYNADVLAQKARDAIRQLGYAERPVDEKYDFGWDGELIEHARDPQSPTPQWDKLLAQRPSPLIFWYRRSQEPMFGGQFHHDLLTPGIVTSTDPAPTMSGMVHVTLDSRGFLTYLEAVPPQLEQEPAPATAGAVDWGPLLSLAGLDPAKLQAAQPQWNFLAASDTRAAWTGTWPDSTAPLRVEAAALGGKPVAFQTIGPWTTPWRVPSATTSSEIVVVLLIFAMAVSIIGGGMVLARRNIREGRGDRAGAFRLACAVAVALWALWVCQVHVPDPIGLMGIFLIAIATITFYGVLFWAIYLALEPFVRRHWPQTLVSWTTLLSGRVRDPIVGRDVLFGVLLGVAIVLVIRGSSYFGFDDAGWPPGDVLLGMRSTLGQIVARALYAMRLALSVFFLLFLMRVLLRNQWVAAIVFVSVFALLNALDSERPLVSAITAFFYFSIIALAVLRWGLTTLTVAALVADLLLMVPATTDLSVWYGGATVLIVAVPLGLAIWGGVTAMGAGQVRQVR